MSRKIITLFSTIILMFAFSCQYNTPPIKPDPGNNNGSTEEPELLLSKREMRAVWLTTAWGLDWPLGKYDPPSQKELYIRYIDLFKELNMNAVIVQIKPMGDAFYRSSYEPWCEWISGTRGKDPGYDVLQFMIEEAHKKGLEFHAWMNPYRIDTRAGSGDSFAPLHSEVKREWVLDLEKIQIYNPALPEVRQRLADIVKELLTDYEVDGIHFDDYFYPYPSQAGSLFSDAEEYAKYGEGYATVEDFRRGNVDKAIKAVQEVIVSTRPEAVFTVSPLASIEGNMNTLFADVVKWCKEGWIDIVMPQLYQQGDAFKNNLDIWSHYNYKATLMSGHYTYQFGASEIARQIGLIRKNKKNVGHAHYRAETILSNKDGIRDRLKQLYNNPAVIPFTGREVAAAPIKPHNVSINNGILSWSLSGDDRAVVYHFENLEKEGTVMAITRERNIPVSAAGYYCVTALNADNKESEPSKPLKK